MNKRHYEHTLPNIRGSLSNTYEIAREFGFSSSAHLTCYCKKQFGTTPTHLREESHIKKQS